MTENQFTTKPPKQFVTLAEAAKGSPYSQEYLSLLARRGKLFSQKVGRNWYTTREAVREYLNKQGLTVIISKDQIGASHQGKISRPIIIGAEALFHTKKDEELELGEQHETKSKILEEFEKLNVVVKTPAPEQTQKKIFQVSTPARISPMQLGVTAETPPHLRPESQPIVPALSLEIEKSLNRISQNLNVISQLQKAQLEKPLLPQVVRGLSQEQNEFYEIESQSLLHKMHRLNHLGSATFSSSKKAISITIAALVLLFLIGGGFSFGNVDVVALRVKDFFKNADTIQGHFAGTHANEVLLLDKEGKVSIYGHIETQGQLRSFVPDGVAPIIVDSTTLVENLNAEYLDGLASKDFTLAFVTKNGNITYDNVFLEGNVEVGKTLTVKGATKLLDSLSVYGKLGVFSEAVFSKDVQLTGGNLKIDKGNLQLASGTIEINNRTMVRNLNAELLQGFRPSDFTLDFAVENGNETNNIAFFNGGLYGGDGAFSSLGVAGDVSIGNENEKDNFVAIFSKKFSLDRSGNLTASGTIAGSRLSAGRVVSDLIPSGSFDLGSSARPWDELVVTSASFGNTIFTGNIDLAGTTSSSFVINTDNTSSDSENSYLAFERGLVTPNARLFWNAASNQFEFNEPLKIASSNFEVVGFASVSSDLYVLGNVGIGNISPDAKLDVTGNILASASGNVDLTLLSVTEDDAKFTLRTTAVANNTARLDILGSASQVFMSIASSGNVGIGTTAPTAKLHVVGSTIDTTPNVEGVQIGED
ncbi:MAG: helix-turn-helix domain-containing protein, partial [Candidatus Yanofskybacteria bacterium]|nr:helix-turn-helix domain-containing protein [Candidatus Yanofskybacteria bacterium]